MLSSFKSRLEAIESCFYSVCVEIHYWQWVWRYWLAFKQYNDSNLTLSDILNIADEAYSTDSQNNPASVAYKDYINALSLNIEQTYDDFLNLELI